MHKSLYLFVLSSQSRDGNLWCSSWPFTFAHLFFPQCIPQDNYPQIMTGGKMDLGCPAVQQKAEPAAEHQLHDGFEQEGEGTWGQTGLCYITTDPAAAQSTKAARQQVSFACSCPSDQMLAPSPTAQKLCLLHPWILQPTQSSSHSGCRHISHLCCL